MRSFTIVYMLEITVRRSLLDGSQHGRRRSALVTPLIADVNWRESSLANTLLIPKIVCILKCGEVQLPGEHIALPCHLASMQTSNLHCSVRSLLLESAKKEIRFPEADGKEIPMFLTILFTWAPCVGRSTALLNRSTQSIFLVQPKNTSLTQVPRPAIGLIPADPGCMSDTCSSW